uniref:Ribosomal protein S10 n=1 Tax=Ulva fenestrata TaxID=83795 RepID=A0A7L9R4K3_9CHLO|nr:ribosomal protein S10 [Ulva fenestrata]QOL10311.1 ribosomal protein S10 [Ulva fenestrata]
MLIKKQHNKNNIANVGVGRFRFKLTELKQPHCVKTPTFNKNPYFGFGFGDHAETEISQTQNSELIISFRSYTICQAEDMGSAMNTIEKLVHYLNSLCAKQLHTYFELCTIRSVLYSKARTNSKFSPVVLGFFTLSYTDLLNWGYQSTILPRYQKQQSEHKAIYYTNDYKSNSKMVGSQLTNNLKQNSHEIFQQSYSFNRCFFKLSKQLSSLSAINAKLVQRRNSKKLFTLIRSPFVFKKTREQFSLQRISSHIAITLANAAQKQFLIKNLRLLKLPVELKVVSRN